MDCSILSAIGVCLLVIILIQRFSSSQKYPPGPIGFPFIGYIPFLSRKLYLDFQKLAKKYGNVFSIRLGSVYTVVLNDFESMREAFSQDAFMGRPSGTPFNLNKETLETGALNDLPWKEQRRFSLHQLRDLGLGKSKMEGHIQEEIGELLDLLEKNADKPFCLSEILSSSMSNNISSLVFGKRLKYDNPDRQMMTKILKATGPAIGKTAWQIFFPWLKKICRYLGIGDIDRIHRIQKKLRDYTWKEINEHEKTLDSNNIRDFIDGYLIEIENRKGNPAFCTMHFVTSEVCQDIEKVLQDLVAVFFGAGSETVRLTVEWLTLTAAAHQDAQIRIQSEIDESVGKGQPITWLDHKTMPFTEAFIMELMRWRTIVPINLPRYALTDGEISGYFVPKGSIILANIWAVHHDPEYWGEDADEFRPERFLTEDGQEIKKLERFMPFSIGKRQCPGEPMAKVEVFMYFTSILQKFIVKVPEGQVADLEGDLGIGLMPRAQELIFTKRS